MAKARYQYNNTRPWNDMKGEGNSSAWHNGTTCVLCGVRPAGCFWSDELCAECNATRQNEIADRAREKAKARRYERQQMFFQFVPHKWPERAAEAAAEILAGSDS